jgi:hypothetical protein
MLVGNARRGSDLREAFLCSQRTVAPLCGGGSDSGVKSFMAAPSIRANQMETAAGG